MKKILIIDDDDKIRDLYVELFSKNGFEVLIGKDGVEGLDQATRNENIDLIFTGIIMPRMDGFQLVSSLKEYSSTAKIPVVVNSHLGREEDRIKMKELGVKDFIVNGVTAPKDVLARVFNVIGKGTYLLKISEDFDGKKFIKNNMSGKDKCPKCESSPALKLRYLQEGEFNAKIACPNCDKE